MGVSASLGLYDQGSFCCWRGIDRNRETPPEEAMPKTRSLELQSDGPLKRCRQRFGERHLDFMTDKKGEMRNVSIWDIQGWPEQLCRFYKRMFRGRALGRNKAGAGRAGLE